MRIVTAREMRAADADTFTRLGVPSRAVMEVAGRAVVHAIVARFENELRRVAIVTGGGNNGGDGFVAARHLGQLGCAVLVIAAKGADDLHGDAQSAAHSFIAAGGVVHELPKLGGDAARALLERFGPTLLLDAVFGTGFQGPARGEGAVLVEMLMSESQRTGARVVSIDVPSGLDADSADVPGECVNADVTVCLQALKPCHAFFPAAGRCGEVIVVDIGVALEGIVSRVDGRELVTEELAAALIAKSPAFKADAYKGKRGHVLVIGGSAGHYGAPKLSAEAALRAGAGLVTVVLPHAAAERLAPHVDEVMCASLPDDSEGSFAGTALDRLEAMLQKRDAVVVGPGLGTGEGSERLLLRLCQLLERAETALILDADALNIVARSAEVREALPGGCIVTPHPGEMGRLLGSDPAEVQRDRIGSALSLRSSLHATTVLKGARTITAVPGGSIYVNPAANPALATAGTGDVLAGVIGGLCAQGLVPAEAAVAGVFIHGAAADLLTEEGSGPYGVLAGDIAKAVPRVLNYLRAIHGAAQPVATMRHVLPGSLGAFARSANGRTAHIERAGG